MSGNALNGMLFLISLVFDFYIFVLVMRFLLARVCADHNLPMTQFVVKLTSFIVLPLKKFCPDIRNIETSTIVLIFLVEIVKSIVLVSMSYGIHNVLGLFILAFGDGLRLFLMTLSLLLFIQVILGLVQSDSPIYQIFNKITSPLTRPLQRVIPPVAGLDLSPIIIIIILVLLIITLLDPIVAQGLGVAAGA